MSDTVMVCTKCGDSKPVEEFNRNRAAPGGRVLFCRECSRTRYRDWWLRNKDHVRAVNRERNAANRSSTEGRERSRAASRDYYQRNAPSVKERRLQKLAAEPEKERARWMVRDAIKHGRISPPPSCESCGHDFSFFRREAHHDDYAQPFNVAWLCAKCHAARRHKTEVLLGH